jgi:hypothetical protein
MSQVKGFTVVTMNPFMMEQRGFVMKESSCAEFAAQFFVCEQTNRINGRRTTTTLHGNSIGASRPHPHLPGGRHICLAHEDPGITRARLPPFAISRSVVTTTLRRSTKARKQNEKP